MMSKSPILKRDHDRVSAITHLLIGSRISSVEYRQTKHGGLLAKPVGNCHEVDLDVLLQTSAGIVEITWERDDLVEGISVSILTEKASADGVVDVVASDSREWASFVDREIVDVTCGWHMSESDCPESMWSLRLEVDSGMSVVFALGELDEAGVPRYFPDSLLVIFDEQAAKSYKHSGVIGNAWASRC